MPEDDAFFIVDAKITDQGVSRALHLFSTSILIQHCFVLYFKVYTCTAQNSVGTIKANATLIVQESPSFVKPMENKEVNCGKTAVIECMASPVTPKPVISWLKDDKPIEATERHFFAADDQLLIIVGTEIADSGTYTCQMENHLGVEFGHMQLKVKSNVVSAINIDEMTGIVIITIVCCAVGTSIIWVVIIYQTKKGGLCAGSGGSATSVPETVENTTSTGTSILVRQFPVYVSVNDSAKGYGTTSHSFNYDDLGHVTTMRLGDVARKHEETSALINQNPIISRRIVPQAIGENFETDDSEEESVFNPSSLSDDRSGNTVTNEMASIHSSANVLKHSPTNREEKCHENGSVHSNHCDAVSSTADHSHTIVVLQKQQQPVLHTFVGCNADN